MGLIRGYNVGQYVNIQATYQIYVYDLMIKVTKDMMVEDCGILYFNMYSQKVINEIRFLTGLKKEVIQIVVMLPP